MTFDKDRIISMCNDFSKNTLMETLEIEYIDAGEGFLVAKMPVNPRVHQPMGLLHGGASAALIESIGSMGSSLLLDLEKEYPVGLEVNANHVGGIKSGMVKAVGKIVHAGKKTHVWQVDIFDQETNKMVATGRLTVLIIQK